MSGALMIEQKFDRMGTAPNRERQLSPGPDHPNHLTDWRATVNGTRVCQISDCSGRTIGRGFCSKHYQRVLKYGDPHYTKNAYAAGSPDGKRAKAGTSVTERLARYGKPDGECVVWNGGRTPFGYGLINIEGRMEGVHRAIWAETHGAIPAGMVVRHKCDNPPCFRIDHLEIGSRSDNMRDWVERGRFRTTVGGAS